MRVREEIIREETDMKGRGKEGRGRGNCCEIDV
jgi:hypothetical protein